MSGIIGGAGSKSGIIGETELSYEEGSYTPAVSEGNAPFTNASGYYVKIGRMCHVSGRFDLNEMSNGTGANFSLPFASAAEEGKEGSGCFYSNGTSDFSDFRFKNRKSSSMAFVRDAETGLTYTTWTVGSRAGWLFGFTYRTA